MILQREIKVTQSRKERVIILHIKKGGQIMVDRSVTSNNKECMKEGEI